MTDAIKVPKGYDDEDAFLKAMREEFQQDLNGDRNNREAALDDLKFMADFEGAQWDAGARANRLKLGLPCLTINQLQQLVAQVSGDNRINKPSIKVRPAEDADEDLAEVRGGLIRAIEWASDASGVYGKASDSQIVCGIGNFRVKLEYAGDDVFDQDIRIKPIPNALSVVWDCMSVERTGRDARRCWVVDEIPRKVFEETYKDQTAADLGDMSTGIVSEGWANRDTVRVVEAWRIKETPRTLALTKDGKVLDVTGKKGWEADVQRDSAGKPRVREVMKRSAVMYLITGFKVLEGPYELPITRLPIFKVTGREVHVGEATLRFGLIRFAKDSQRLKNYWRSVSAQLLGWAPKAVWLADRRSVEGVEEDFRGSASSGDPLLVWTGQGTEPKRVDPPPIPAAILQEVAMNTQDMKDVTGLHDASLGIQSNETSGKAILARQREGDVATVEYHDNLNASIRECGTVINQLIPVCYDTLRTIRVLGADEEAKLVKINDPNDPDSIDMGKGKYDIVVETGPSYSTRRVEAADSLMQAVQSFPQLMGIAGDLIVKAQDWPDAEPIAERLKKALPAQLTQGDEEPTPEQQQQAQQAAQEQAQAQQMAQTAAQLELMGKQADVRKSEAEAAKAEAEAAQAQHETLNAEAMCRKAAADAVKAEADAVTAQAKAAMATHDADMAPFNNHVTAINAGLDLSDRLTAEPEEPATQAVR